MREAIGPETVFDICLSVSDWAEGGVTGEETVAFSRELMEAGVDVLYISNGENVSTEVPVGPGYQLMLAQQVRRAVADSDVPVVDVGLIEEAAQAEQALISGQADTIAMGRTALHDPYLPLRWTTDLRVHSWEEAPWSVQYWRGTWS